jgi:hypothetical protein
VCGKIKKIILAPKCRGGGREQDRYKYVSKARITFWYKEAHVFYA